MALHQVAGRGTGRSGVYPVSTILIVDDSATFRDAISGALRKSGYETVCAADGEEALNLVPTAKPSLILLDLGMPEMGGIRFLRELRAKRNFGRTPVIIVTGLAERQQVEKAAELGVTHYVLKSGLSLKDLIARVKIFVPPLSGSEVSADD